MLHVQTLPGLTGFTQAYELQRRLAEELAQQPRRDAHLVLLQHQPVYTLGRSTKPEHLPMPAEQLAAWSKAEVCSTDRGGSVTYHGPGQLTAYVILHLKAWEIPIHQHLWNLEEAVVKVLKHYGLQSSRVDGMTGVWSQSASQPQSAKVCAVGVGCKRWVTYHGIGLNVDMDLKPFSGIDPCGLGQKPVTTLSKLTGKSVSIEEASQKLTQAFEDLLQTKSV